MSDDEPKQARRFPTRWSVIAFVVLALAVCIAIMIWQSRGAPPEHTDVGLGALSSANS